MSLTKMELEKEKQYLNHTIEVIRDNISSLGQDLFEQEAKVMEFKRFMWDNKSSMDPHELKSMRSDSDLEVYLMQQKGKYFQKLYRIQNNPYFGSIIFQEDDNKDEEIYIGITHLEEDDKHLIHDWRSPICSLFYDYEVGPCTFKAPKGNISGNLKRKRQYKIKNGNLLHVFDNNIQVDDELLQEVLASESTEKMKNIVNTIQQEQNAIIRNTTHKNLIVQGIAGSGKTSVALHRIVFLLYKIENLRSDQVLIFSPNKIFTEYISNVLPELGEDNTMQTTFHEFMQNTITEFKTVESFSNFISRYYQYKEKNTDLITYKQSDSILEDIKLYVEDLTKQMIFHEEISDHILYNYSKKELNYLFHKRYNHFPLLKRIEEMSIKLSEVNFNGKHHKAKSFQKQIFDSLHFKKDIKQIYINFFKSPFAKFNMSDNEIKQFIKNKEISYEDACLFVYFKSLLEGFDYNTRIKQVVIDEAQDYSLLQIKILSQIFKNSGFTILGDINQTINPYYKYDNLNKMIKVLNGESLYLELNKTYRSTKEIIEYTNKILGLNHVSAIRNENDIPVRTKYMNSSIDILKQEIEILRKKHKSVAIITKDIDDAIYLKEKLSYQDLVLLTGEEEVFAKTFLVIPSYIAKGLEFDAVIIYENLSKPYLEKEQNLYYVACTRAQHELVVIKN